MAGIDGVVYFEVQEKKQMTRRQLQPILLRLASKMIRRLRSCARITMVKECVLLVLSFLIFSRAVVFFLLLIHFFPVAVRLFRSGDTTHTK